MVTAASSPMTTERSERRSSSITPSAGTPTGRQTGSRPGMPRFMGPGAASRGEAAGPGATVPTIDEPPGSIGAMTPEEALRAGEQRGREQGQGELTPDGSASVPELADLPDVRSVDRQDATTSASSARSDIANPSLPPSESAQGSDSSEPDAALRQSPQGDVATVEGETTEGVTSPETAAAGESAEVPAEERSGAAEEEGAEGEGGEEEESEPGEGEAERRPRTEGDGEAVGSDLAGMEGLAAADLDLIDTELAEHQRWAGAQAEVGTAMSAERAAFVISQISEGFMAGAAGGAGMGLSLGLLHRGLATQAAARVGGRLAARMGGSALARTGDAAQAAARMAGRLGTRLGPRVAAQTARFTPLPAIGAVVGGVISFHSLYTRDWRQTAQTLSSFGEGGSKYEKLANSIAAISEVVDIVSNALNVIAGILGIITLALWAAAILSAGALSPLAGTLTAISLAIGVVTLALDAINMIVLQPSVTLFRALHAFTSEADPREVVADGQQLSAAAANNGGALGGLLGARAANIGGARPTPDTPESTTRGDDTPPPAGGEGPRVDFQARPEPPDLSAVTPRPAEGAPTTLPEAPTTPRTTPETPVLPRAETPPPATARPPRPGPEYNWVEGYTRRDGTPVRGHWRRTGRTTPTPSAARPPRPGPEYNWVEGYTRSDGTPVSGHWRRTGRGGGGGSSGDGGGGGTGGRRRPRTPAEEADLVEAAGRQARAASIRREGRKTAIENLRESVESGIYDPQSARTVEDLGPGRVEEFLNPPAEFEGEPRPGSRAEGRNISIEHSDLPRLADQPLEPQSGGKSHLTSYEEHRQGHHGGDTRQPIELGEPRAPDWDATREPARDFTPDPDAARRSALDPSEPMESGFEESRGWQTREGTLPTEDVLNDPSLANHPDPRIRQAYAEFQASQGGGGSTEGGSGPGPSPAPETAETPPATSVPETAETPLATSVPETEAVPPVSEPATDQAELTPPSGARSPAAPSPVTGAGATAARAQDTLEPGASTGSIATSSATASASGRPAPGTEPSLLQTFFPILYAGEHGPSPEEQQEAFNAQFTSDFPPVDGVERANPAYPEPPCTPAQIDAIRGHIAELQAARAQTRHAEGQMDTQIEAHEANEQPLNQTIETTEAGVSAAEQHGEKVDSTADANEQQQERQSEVNDAVGEYDDHSGAIDGLRTPLRAFRGMMHLASYLPGDAGEAMSDMNRDAGEMLTAFDEMDASMTEQQDTGGVCEEQLQSEGAEIEGVSMEAAVTHEELTTAVSDANALSEQNAETIADATERRATAEDATARLDDQIEEQESTAQTLTQELQTWAQQHRDARMVAVEATRAKVEQLDLTVTEVHTE